MLRDQAKEPAHRPLTHPLSSLHHGMPHSVDARGGEAERPRRGFLSRRRRRADGVGSIGTGPPWGSGEHGEGCHDEGHRPLAGRSCSSVPCLVAILALRFVRPSARPARRRVVVLGAVGAGVRSGASSRWSPVRDAGIDALVELVVTQQGLPRPRRADRCGRARDGGVDLQARRRSGCRSSVRRSRSAGGLVDLAWVMQKRVAGDAIDPDTLTASAGRTASGPGERCRPS